MFGLGESIAPDAAMAAYRNRCVAALADAVFIAYAAPGRKTAVVPCLRKGEALCREVVAWGKPVYTFDSPHNATLITVGARAVVPEHLIAELVGG